MRHIFLPNKEQTILKRRYLIRVAIVLFFLFSVSGLIGISSLFPTYISLNTEEQSQIKMVNLLKKNKDNSGIARLQNELKADADKIQILAAVSVGATPSDLIERIIVARGQVHITSIIINEVSTTTANITLGGVAPTRESLVAFKTRLQGLSVGNKVDLPISGFAKSKDIPFSLKVIHILP